MARRNKQDYVALTPEMIGELQGLRLRTGCGGIAAFRYLQCFDLLPEESKLTAAKICAWLASPPKTVHPEEFKLALNAFQAIADNPACKERLFAKRGPTLASRSGANRIEVTEEFRERIDWLLAQFPNTGITGMLRRNNAPTGLTVTLLRGIASGERSALHAKHALFLEELLSQLDSR